MDAMLEFYQEQVQGSLSSLPWLADIQKQALKEFKNAGFPTGHNEDWKYTPLGSFLKQAFVQKGPLSVTWDSKRAEIPCNQTLSIYNGSITDYESLKNQLPEGVIVLPLTQALNNHTDLIKPYLGALLKPQHGFDLLNTAMIHCGVFIYIPQGIHIDEPIALRHYQNQNNQALHLRHLIIMEPNSQASVLELYEGEKACTYFTNTVTEIFLKPKSSLTHYKIQTESHSAYHIGHVTAQQTAMSEFASHSLSLGGKLVRSDISLYLKEEGAHCLMNGIYAPSEGQHVDHHTTVEHLVPHCQSIQDYKGILKGHSRAVFNGKIRVAKQAQKTSANQQNKNLLLSSKAEINTKPQLEIFADDVLCSHGATVGQLDTEALFYLQSRGMSPKEATDLLIRAFAWDNLNRIAHPGLVEWMGHLLTQQME